MRCSRISTLMSLAVTLMITGAASQFLPSSLSTSCGAIDLLNNTLGCCMCEDNNQDWYNNTIGIFTSVEALYRSYVNSYSKWTQACSWGQGVLGCMKDKIPGCTDDDVGEKFVKQLGYTESAFVVYSAFACPSCAQQLQYGLSWAFLLNFYGRFCNDGQIKPDIQTLVSDPSVDVSCIRDTLYRDVTRCASSFTPGFNSTTLDDIPALIRNLKSIVADILNCLFSVINLSTCNTATKKVLYKVVRLLFPPSIDDGTLVVDESTTEDFRSKLRCTVGVYGDPHLKTCWSPGLVGCSAPGEQIYFKNKFLLIKGTNVEIGSVTNPRATSMKSVTVAVSSLDGNTALGTYTATNGSLPSTFDAVVDTEVGTGNDEVEIHSDPFNRKRFVQKGTGAVLILRQWNGNYFFTLRMAENVMVASKGLLIDGCPPNQVFSRSTFSVRRRKRAVTTSSCEASCNNTVLDVGFKEACVVDCLATDDPDFATNMTTLAVEDNTYVLTYDSSIIAQGDDDKGRAVSVGYTGISLLVSAMILIYRLQSD